MSVRRALNRSSADQRGFTLPEVLVAMVMMLTVMFALYSIFDMSLRVFSYGNDKTEVAQNARVGLEKMEREIRAAYHEDGDESDPLLDTWNSDEVSFYNSGSEEQITYSLDDSTLKRNNAGAVENVDGAGGLEFKYLQSVNPYNEADNESQVSIIRIKLEVKKQGQQDAEQTLTTDVHLRNRSSDE